LEPIVARELTALGAAQVSEVAGGVTFKSDLDMVMRANLWLRSASRVLVVIAGGRARHWKGLTRVVDAAAWDDYLRPDTAVRFKVSCSRSRLYHQRAVVERLQAAVGRPAPGPDEDGVTVWVRIHEDQATISIDSSGALLHRRGYRTHVGQAPLRETLAAGILLATWDPATPLLDPMCGSGTFLIEAAWIAQGRAPGLSREFAFQSWPSHSASAWSLLVKEARAAQTPLNVDLVGVDYDADAVQAASANAERAGVTPQIEHADIRDVSATEDDPGTIVVNPPYGKRIGRGQAAFKDVEALAGRMKGWRTVALYALKGHLPAGWETVMRVRNGGIAIRVIAR